MRSSKNYELHNKSYNKTYGEVTSFLSVLNDNEVASTLTPSVAFKRIAHAIPTYVEYPDFVRSIIIAVLIAEINTNTRQCIEQCIDDKDGPSEATARRVLQQNNLLSYLAYAVERIEDSTISIQLIDTQLNSEDPENYDLVSREYVLGKYYEMKHGSWSGYNGMHLKSVDGKYHYLLFSGTSSPFPANPMQIPFSLMMDAVYDFGWLTRSRHMMKHFLDREGILKDGEKHTIRAVGCSLGGRVAADTVDLVKRVLRDEGKNVDEVATSYMSVGAPGRIGNWHYFYPNAVTLSALLCMGAFVSASVLPLGAAGLLAASIFSLGALFYVIDPFAAFDNSLKTNQEVPTIIVNAKPDSGPIGAITWLPASHPARINPTCKGANGAYHTQVEWRIKSDSNGAAASQEALKQVFDPDTLLNEGFELRQRYDGEGEAIITGIGRHNHRYKGDSGWFNRLVTFLYVSVTQPLLLVLGGIGVLCMSLGQMGRNIWSRTQGIDSNRACGKEGIGGSCDAAHGERQDLLTKESIAIAARALYVKMAVSNGSEQTPAEAERQANSLFPQHSTAPSGSKGLGKAP